MKATFIGIGFGLVLFSHLAKADPPLLAQCSEEKKNADGSLTIVNPRVIRGAETLEISSTASDSKGVCKLFGYEDYLNPSTEASGDSQKTIIINKDGKFEGWKRYNNRDTNSRIDGITCHNGACPELLFISKEKPKKNEDGSYTIENPYTSRGPGQYTISSCDSDFTGVCKGFGFDSYLDKTLVEAGDDAITLAVNEDKQFKHFKRRAQKDYNTHIVSLTCFNAKEPPESVFSAKEKKRNPDGSTSIINPTVKRGKETFEISGSGSKETGICKAFGFDSFQDQTMVANGDVKITFRVDEKGEWDGFSESTDRFGNDRVIHISCYNKDKPPKLVFSSKEKKSNPDGSISLFTLAVSRSAWTYPLSGNKSDPQGLCIAYGYDKYLEETIEKSGDVQKTLIVDKEAKFGGFELYQNRGGSNTQVTAISCYNEKSPPEIKAKASTITRNPDGTVKLEGITVYRGHRSLPASDRSDLGGLCRLLGYKKYLADTMRSSGDLPQTIGIQENGTFHCFYPYESKSTNAGVDSLVCY